MTELKQPYHEWEEALAKDGSVALSLSNTEIMQLRQLAADNGPLARMMQFYLDSATKLSQDVFNVDITTEEGRVAFINAQAQYRALHVQRALLAECLTPQNQPSTANQENADDRSNEPTV